MIAVHLPISVLQLIYFRRHIGACSVESECCLLVFQFRLADVAQTEVPTAVHQDIARLDVAVIDALALKGSERGGDIHAKLQRQGAVLRDLRSPLIVIDIPRHANQHSILNYTLSLRADKCPRQKLRLFQILRNVFFSAEALHDFRFPSAGKKAGTVKCVLPRSLLAAVCRLQWIGDVLEHGWFAVFPVHDSKYPGKRPLVHIAHNPVFLQNAALRRKGHHFLYPELLIITALRIYSSSFPGHLHLPYHAPRRFIRLSLHRTKKAAGAVL